MFRSRTVKSLCALVAAMTLGAIALMLMERDPVRPPAPHLAAVSGARDEPLDIVVTSRVPFQPLKWRNIVVHSTPSARNALVPGCHFVVDMQDRDGPVKIQRTGRWEDQSDGRHVFVRGVNWNANSIGVCLVGDLAGRPPSRQHLDGVLRLVRKLQEQFQIPRDNVYLAGDIGQQATSPGPAFPAERFNSRLLPTTR